MDHKNYNLCISQNLLILFHSQRLWKDFRAISELYKFIVYMYDASFHSSEELVGINSTALPVNI